MNLGPTTPKPTTAQPFAPLGYSAALDRLKTSPNWVAWDYVWNAEREDWGKVPINPRTGNPARSNDANTWSSYDAAEKRAVQDGLAGVGYMLSEDDDLEGGDLDACRNPLTGEIEGWAQDILRLAETYCEVSPSGTGIRMFFDGKKDKPVKFDPAHVELYSRGRYLTLTGVHLAGTPRSISASAAMRAAMVARVDTMRAAKQAEKQAQAAAQPTLSQRATAARPDGASSRKSGGDYFRNVNNRALGNLTSWVPALFGAAATYQAGTNGYRISSRTLGRNLQEDLSITPLGTKDWGVHDMGDPRDGGRTAIDLVLAFGDTDNTPVAAASWLCRQLGLEPEALGWRNGAAADGTSDVPRKERDGDGRPKHEQVRQPFHQGRPTPLLRDPLKIAQALADPEPFPLNVMPPLLRGAIEGMTEHMQAPLSLCASSIIGAAALVCQAHADIAVPALPKSKPLSLFLLSLALSGERKTAVDTVALLAISEKEAELRRVYEDEMEAYRAAKQAHDAERKSIGSNKKLDQQERREAFAALVEPPEPLWPTMRVKEPTFEGLANLLLHGRGSVGLFTSEGGQFLGSHGMTEDAKVRTITGLSELWDDGSAQRVRARELTIMNGRRVSISLAVQPRLATALLGDETARDQGFVGRFLMTMPESNIGRREIRISEPMKDARLQAFHRRCRQLLDREFQIIDGSRNEIAPPDIHLSTEAWELWRHVAQSIEDGCVKEGVWYQVRSAALKMGENIARLAGIFAIFEDPSILDKGFQAEVSIEIMQAACEVGGFYLMEALRLVGHKAIGGADQEADELAEWLRSKWPGDLISPTHIQQKAPRHLRGDAKTIRTRVQALQDAGVIDLIGPGEIDGKSFREVYRIVREA